MLWISGFVWGMLFGILLSQRLQKWLERRDKPYVWVCPVPGCHSRAASNSIEVTDLAARIHEESGEHK